MSQVFQLVLKFIEIASLDCEVLGTLPRILIHCHKGLSRSVTLGLAYMMSHRGYSLDAAIDLASSLNPDICPNVGFVH